MLAHALSEIVRKDSFDIYQNARKYIIDEKPDGVTLRESHYQEKAQIHKKFPSPRPLHLNPSQIPTAK